MVENNLKDFLESLEIVIATIVYSMNNGNDRRVFTVNGFAEVVDVAQWESIEDYFTGALLDNFQIMRFNLNNDLSIEIEFVEEEKYDSRRFYN